jgi:hypothetical protein
MAERCSGPHARLNASDGVDLHTFMSTARADRGTFRGQIMLPVVGCELVFKCTLPASQMEEFWMAPSTTQTSSFVSGGAKAGPLDRSGVLMRADLQFQAHVL